MSGERNAPVERQSNRQDYEDDDIYRLRLTIRQRNRLQQALNTATVDTGLEELVREDEEKDQQALLNASYIREMTIRDRMNNRISARSLRSEYGERFARIMDITGTRSRRETQNNQLRTFAENVGINETSRIDRSSIIDRETGLQGDQADTTVITGTGSADRDESGTRDTDIEKEQDDDDHDDTRESKQSDLTIDRRGNVDISTIDPNRIRSAMRRAGSIRKSKSVRFRDLKRSVDIDDIVSI